MKIQIAIYVDEDSGNNITLAYSEWILTDLSIPQIKEHIQPHYPYYSKLCCGNHLSFFDVYCRRYDVEEYVQRIKTISRITGNRKNEKDPCLLRVKRRGPDEISNSPIYDREDNYYLYCAGETQWGAGGFEEIAYWASTHPIEMVFIGGVLYDCAKWLLLNILKRFGCHAIQFVERPVFLRIKKFYSNFEDMTRIEKGDCQIISFKRLKSGLFYITVRTVSNEQYSVKCYANGKIESLSLKSNKGNR